MTKKDDSAEPKEAAEETVGPETAEEEAASSDDVTETQENEADKEVDASPADDQLLRLRADFDNFRKRVQRDKADWSRDTTARVMETLLPVLDHFRMGLDNARQHEAKPEVLEGFEMVWQQLDGALGQLELKAVPSVGEPFDPACHEALQMVPSDEVEADVVVDEFRRGYRLGERLLRPAQVIVSSGPVTSTEEAEAGASDV